MKKSIRLKLSFFFAIFASIIISVAISCLFNMHYMTHLYALQSINSDTFMKVSKRIDLVEQRAKDNQSEQKKIKPVSL